MTSEVGAIALGTEISEYVRGVALDSAVCSCPLLAEWTMSQENIDKVPEDAKIEQLVKLIEYEEKLRAVESEETRKSRRNVLIASLIGIGMSVTGAVQKKIEALDIEFDANNRFAFLFLIAAVIAYFMISLSINYYSDRKTGGRLFRAYAKIIDEQLRQEITRSLHSSLFDHIWGEAKRPFNYALPMIVGCIAILCVFTYSFYTWVHQVGGGP